MNTEPRHILEDILETITASESPEQSLDRIVKMIAEQFRIEGLDRPVSQSDAKKALNACLEMEDAAEIAEYLNISIQNSE